ncbi:MAG: hypothetical protein ACTS4X_01980 [Candidatus Hodgkinia cicadicola]
MLELRRSELPSKRASAMALASVSKIIPSLPLNKLNFALAMCTILNNKVVQALKRYSS